MKTLYDILGVSAHATPAQIELAYQSARQALGKSDAPPETEVLRARALKEAHAVLSVPSRRQAYDDKLQGRLQAAEKTPFPWIKASFAVLLLFGSFAIYKVQEQRAAAERVAAEASKAKAAAELAAKQAEAEQARLEQQKLATQRQQESQQRFEQERARTEGQFIHARNEAADARATREAMQAERDKAQAERQRQQEQAREEQAARLRSQQETAAMQRALSIPIRRH